MPEGRAAPSGSCTLTQPVPRWPPGRPGFCCEGPGGKGLPLRFSLTPTCAAALSPFSPRPHRASPRCLAGRPFLSGVRRACSSHQCRGAEGRLRAAPGRPPAVRFSGLPRPCHARLGASEANTIVFGLTFQRLLFLVAPGTDQEPQLLTTVVPVTVGFAPSVGWRAV